MTEPEKPLTLEEKKLALEHEKFHVDKHQQMVTDMIAMNMLHKTWKYKYAELFLSMAAIVIFVLLIVWLYSPRRFTSPPEEKVEHYAPYAGILTHDIYRSDPAFDESKREW